MPDNPELPVDPRLAGVVAMKRARKRGRTPDVVCDKADCGFIGRSNAEMAEHLVDAHPTGVFGPDKQDEYIGHILQGVGRHTAARKIGLSPATVARFIGINPAFERSVMMAEEEYTEQTEQKLYEAANGGEPWAIKEVLSKRNSRRWGSVPQEVNITQNISVKGELNASPQVQRVMELMANLEKRALMQGDREVIDAEVVDE